MYDVIIIGGGISGMMCAHRLIQNNSALKILLLEKGMDIHKRNCPIIAKKTEICAGCKSCGVTEGLSGAGAFSDGKYVISTEYGGWLTDYMRPDTVMEYIESADNILMSYGATDERYMPNDQLKLECLKQDLHMQQAQLKHLGTDANFETMCKMADDLKEKIDLRCNTTALDINKDTHEVRFTSDRTGEETVTADKIIFAVGRSGSRFLSKWCSGHGVPLENTQVDIGVRVELPSIIWNDFSSRIYEPKIWYQGKQYGDITRMFCFNNKGHVVVENTDGILTVNGHSYRDDKLKTNNSNFALLTTIKFTEPFNEPIQYARSVATLANMVSGGGILVQRLGDLENGKRTNEKRLSESTTIPTLRAVPGDLSLCMPKRQLDNIIETLHALDKIAPGTANYDTLLYGIECKYYSARPSTKNFEIKGCDGIYAIGDGAGFTRSLSHAAANGLYVADRILEGKK